MITFKKISGKLKKLQESNRQFSFQQTTAFSIFCCSPAASPGGPPVEPGLEGIATSAAKCFFLCLPIFFWPFCLFLAGCFVAVLWLGSPLRLNTFCRLCYHLGWAPLPLVLPLGLCTFCLLWAKYIIGCYISGFSISRLCRLLFAILCLGSYATSRHSVSPPVALVPPAHTPGRRRQRHLELFVLHVLFFPLWSPCCSSVSQFCSLYFLLCLHPPLNSLLLFRQFSPCFFLYSNILRISIRHSLHFLSPLFLSGTFLIIFHFILYWSFFSFNFQIWLWIYKLNSILIHF